MERRDILKMIMAATGTAFIGTPALAYTVRPEVNLTDTGFSQDDVALLNEVGECIIPRTDTPGAKDANVGEIMAVMVADCYTLQEQEVFKAGLLNIDTLAKQMHQKAYFSLSYDQRFEIASELDKEARDYNQKNAQVAVSSEQQVPHFFSMIKQLTLFGFFTSEIGATKVLRHVAIPGSYDGDVPYKKGDRAWSR
jgi:hypothetical protein